MNVLFRCFSCIFLLAALPLIPSYAANPIGKLYTMSNATTGNEILIYSRLSDGGLSKITHAPTGGTGTGGGLGNQSALAISKDGFFVFAVNAGSNSISSFRITVNGLALVSTIPSNGIKPVSLTEDRGRLFVLNAGDTSNPGNIFGFRVNQHGRLSPIHYTKRLLSNHSASTGAAQISFSNDGHKLVITEKATDQILTFHLNAGSVPSWPVINASSGTTPFGFAVGKRDQLFVSNAAGGVANLSSLSSYRLQPWGKLANISPAVPTGETAACWVALTSDGRYAYTTNTASGTISSFQIELNGKATLAEAKAGISGAGPIDMVVSPENHFLYTLNSGNDSISSFEVALDGKLNLVSTLEKLPDGANGLVAQ
jgi:6-phosphogluconolactonase